jgi:uncharacterized SAM-binding protein YcdF (DUF218 family)
MAIVSSWLLAAFALDRVGSAPVPSGRHYDAIVVAGAGVLAGGRPGRPLEARVTRAVELFHAGFADRIVMTGGVGSHPPAESIVAARLAESLGVPPSALLLEEVSTSTEENALETARLLGPNAEILLVTDRFHVFRARRVFARHLAHVDAVGSVCSPWPRFRGAMREVIALIGYRVRGRI